MLENYIIESADYLLPSDIEVYEFETHYNIEPVWKDLCFTENGITYDYTGLYQVSHNGDIKSLIGKEKILKPGSNKKYWFVYLSKNGESKKFYLHRLVAHMFVDGYFDGAIVNHKDENPDNNHISNLEWCDYFYNNNYGNKNDKYKGENHPRAILIDRFTLDGQYVDTKYRFEYVQMGFHAGNIGSCCKGKRNKTGGYVFKYHKKGSDK